MKNTLLAILFGAALLVSGCSTLQKSDTASLQGTWKGYDKAQRAEGTCSVSFSKNTVEFHGADKDDWCKGIFTLHEDTNPKQIVATIIEAPDARVIGQAVHAIYRIEAATLRQSTGEFRRPLGLRRTQYPNPRSREMVKIYSLGKSRSMVAPEN
jgi:uncharacterized protein (TIGR03067 family)